MAVIPTKHTLLPKCEFCFYGVFKNLDPKLTRYKEYTKVCPTCIHGSKFEGTCCTCQFLKYHFSGKYPVCDQCYNDGHGLTMYEINVYKPIEQILAEIKMERY
jgi:hypothetical protein